jgi:hypothetical protein
MARLNDDAQWIVLMGFIISFSLFFLAMVINQSTVVGQTTAESVIEFPKNDIRDIRDMIVGEINAKDVNNTLQIKEDITKISLSRKGAVVKYSYYNTTDSLTIWYNNGVTEYYENWTV